jgi:hypothetical protein
MRSRRFRPPTMTRLTTDPVKAHAVVGGNAPSADLLTVVFSSGVQIAGGKGGA